LTGPVLAGPVLIDRGPIVAILLESDGHYEACVEQLRHIGGPLVICWPVITEAAWLLRSYPRAIRSLLSSFNGRPCLGIQLADASLAHLANREGIELMFTLDRRDFGVLRLAHGKKLRLIP
jgi:uncharacterized protein